MNQMLFLITCFLTLLSLLCLSQDKRLALVLGSKAYNPGTGKHNVGNMPDTSEVDVTTELRRLLLPGDDLLGYQQNDRFVKALEKHFVKVLVFGLFITNSAYISLLVLMVTPSLP